MTEARRETKIINALTILCICAGFLCFALIILPGQLGKMKIGLGSNEPQGPKRLSAIISVGTENSEAKTAKPAPVTVVVPPPKQDEEEFTSLEAPHDESEGPLGSVQIITYPISSLAHRSASVFDGDLKNGKKSWLATPAELEKDVAFWKDVYAKYDSEQAILHHPRYLGIVYDVVDIKNIMHEPRLNDIEKERIAEKRIEDRKEAILEILRHLSTDPPAATLSLEDIRIKKLFDGISEKDAFKNAVEDGVRAQFGQKDKFAEGLKYSGRYMGEIEAIFDSYELPRELTRLVFVESMFNPNAISKASASGIWQFMPDTAKLYLKVNALVDERNDPIRSTFAAARLFRLNFETLGSWPLAINAYNTGTAKIKQAVSDLQTNDIAKIVRNFDDPSYGFASRNFFSEFLAAAYVAEHAEKYFGPIEFDKPMKCEVTKPPYNISLPEVAKISNIEMDELAGLNPSFKGQLIAGKKLLPIGFSVRVPVGKGDFFLAAANRAPKTRAGPLKHLVQSGETLDSIAEMYNVTQKDIMRSNGDMSRFVNSGQTILVPVDKR